MYTMIMKGDVREAAGASDRVLAKDYDPVQDKTTLRIRASNQIQAIKIAMTIGLVLVVGKRED